MQGDCIAYDALFCYILFTIKEVLRLYVWRGPYSFLAYLSQRHRGTYSAGRLRRPSYVFRCPSTILNDFFSETTGPIETKFQMQPREPLGTKSCSKYLGHITKMAAMPIYGETLKNLLLQKQQIDDLET